jgi:hypothetical protein
MTLSTNVYVLGQVDVRELFHFAQGLLTKYDDRPEPMTPADQAWTDGERNPIWDDPGSWVIANRIGQRLPAILDITYRPDEALRNETDAVAHNEDCEPECKGEWHPRACWADLDLDTAYGYRDVRGWGCGDLHAVLVAEIGNWLDQREVRWEWQNEFTGEVHGGEDRYARLVDLVSGGFEASAWFRTSVLPAIAAYVLALPAVDDVAPNAGSAS